MRFTIVLPVFNAEKYIVQCIESWKNQSYKNFELIIVNDGSTDQTSDILDDIQKSDERIKVLHSINGGVSKARNEALKYVTGDILGFCDADDFVDSAILQVVKDEFVYQEIDMVVVGYCVIKNNSESKSVFKTRVKKENWSAEETMERIFCDRRVKGFLCNKFFKADLCRGQVLDEHLTHCEDLYWVMSVLRNYTSMKIQFNSMPLYYYRKHPQSATHNIHSATNEYGELRYIAVLERLCVDFEKNQKILTKCHTAIVKMAANNLYSVRTIDKEVSAKLKKYINEYKIDYFFDKRRTLMEKAMTIVRIFIYALRRLRLHC